MAPLPPLFTLPIPPTGGSITCTAFPAQKIYLLTFSSPPDNRLTPAFCNALHLALDILEHRHPPGVVVTTSAIPKFYSNGLDYESAIKDPGFFEGVLYPLWRRFLTYPNPTVALIPGHAFAGGLMTAMMHDYRLFLSPPSTSSKPTKRSFLCCNELDFGAHLPPPMASIFRVKLPSPTTFRDMVLESKRYTPEEGVQVGLLDGTVQGWGGGGGGGVDSVEGFVERRKLGERGKTGVYARLRGELWRETLGELGGSVGEDLSEGQVQRVEAWERGEGVVGGVVGKAKL